MKVKKFYTEQQNFLSDKIEIENSASVEILHNQVDAIGEFVEEDVTDFVLNEIEQVNAMEEMTDDPDFTLNETMNTEIPASGNCEYITTDSCDVSSASNSNVLSSTEANAIYIVLGEISPLLQRYDCGKTILIRLLKEKLNASINFKDDILNMQCTLQQQIIRKLSQLRNEFEHWERPFLIKNDLCAPTNCDFADNSAITDINTRIDIGNKLLSNWDTDPLVTVD